jgi:hypothetical protein
VEDPVGIDIQVLNTIVPEHSFEELTCGECQSTLYEPGEHWDFIRILLHQVRITGGSVP